MRLNPYALLRRASCCAVPCARRGWMKSAVTARTGPQIPNRTRIQLRECSPRSAMTKVEGRDGNGVAQHSSGSAGAARGPDLGERGRLRFGRQDVRPRLRTGTPSKRGPLFQRTHAYGPIKGGRPALRAGPRGPCGCCELCVVGGPRHADTWPRPSCLFKMNGSETAAASAPIL